MPELINFKSTAAPSKSVLEITSFAGIDLSSAPADVDKRRSPDAPNMMPDSKGNPIKRTGFSLFESYGERINGAFVFGESTVIHSGTKLFYNGKEIWDGMADELSSGQIIGNTLCIFDGFEAISFDGDCVVPLCDNAYIPTVLISKNADECERETVLKGDGMSTIFALEHEPETVLSLTVNGKAANYSIDGTLRFETAPEEGAEIILKAKYKNEPGGAGKEEFNLLSDRWKESFLCDTGTEKAFTLSQKELSGQKVLAWVMDENGEMQEKEENVDFTVDRAEGKILFKSFVGKTPIVGQDNLIIEAAKHFEGYKDKINRCCRSIVFDTGGTTNRIFVSGNPEELGRDYWCATGDPTYWPDTYYSQLGTEKSEIIGYSVVEGYLATHIAPAYDGRSIVLRTSQLDENGNVFFPIIKHLQGEEAVAPRSFIYMEKEPLFLTGRGVYAITAEDVSGEKYTQNRSYFINKALFEQDLKNAFCAKWKQFYLIAFPGKLYLIDTSQRSYQRGEPLSSFQYECYLWTGINARVLWEQGGELFFGDYQGNVCRFTERGYSDNGKAINAYWTFPDFAGESFWRNKTVRTIAVQTAAFSRNEIRLEYRKDGFWNLLKEWKGKLSYFSWSGFSWTDFSWSGDSTPRTLTLKTKIKKFDKTAFRLVCDHDEKAFGLYGFALEFTESGRYKK